MQKSNIAELMLNDEVKALLTLCATEQSDTLLTGSDYDRFLHFCRCFPLFYGHPVRSAVQQYLKTYFDSELAIIPQNAEKLWHLTAELLLRSNETVPDFVFASQPFEVQRLPQLSAGDPYTAFPANRLSETHATSWNEWREEMDAILAQACSAPPAQWIRIDLNEQIGDQRPSLYHVEQVLQKKKRTRADHAVLSAQVFRYVCEYCKETDVRVVVHLDTPREIELLKHIEKSVGLPPVLCVANGEKVQDTLVDLICSARVPIALALDYDDFSSYPDFAFAAVSLAKKYPLGRLTVLEDNLQKRFVLS